MSTQELFEQISGLYETAKTNHEETSKLVELGKKLQSITKEWETAKDKKPVIAKMTKLLSAEKLKRLDKKQQEKKEKVKE